MIIWRYLLGNYIKVLFFCVVSFIAILLLTRLDEIAQFASLGGQTRYLLLFVFYQIPFILPIAIPISALISSMILFQKLSATKELIALRASGFSLKKICIPILCAGLIFSFLNFLITSELATSSRMHSRKMITELTSVNPIILLQNAKIAKLKGAFVQMETIRSGELAKNIIIAVNNRPCQRLNLFITKEMELKDQILNTKNVSFISSIGLSHLEEPDHLIIENQKNAQTLAPQFANILKKSNSRVPNDHLKLSYLRYRLQNLKDRIGESAIVDAHLKKNLNRCHTDIMRRVSLGLSPFSFTLMGTSFGMEISRRSSKKGLIAVIGLGVISLVSFFIAKEMDHKLILSTLLYFLPHTVILIASLVGFSRINRGLE